jgi:hypothetical protein
MIPRPGDASDLRRFAKPKPTAITGPTIVTVTSKWDRIRRREEAAQAREVSPEEDARAEAFLARMMRPPGT